MKMRVHAQGAVAPASARRAISSAALRDAAIAGRRSFLAHEMQRSQSTWMMRMPAATRSMVDR
jgi:hypothetical protein